MKTTDHQPIADYVRQLWPDETRRLYGHFARFEPKGVFMTGIENSDPIAAGRRRNLLLEAHDFSRHFKERLGNIRDLGIRWVRYGPGYSMAHPAQDIYDFALTDEVLAECQKLGLTVVADLLHFGLPDWLHAGKSHEESHFQNTEFPERFACYVDQFVKRYPHIQYYTPVNEPYVTAMFSAKLGKWNEQLDGVWEDDRYFVRATANIARAAILARQTIELVWEREARQQELIFFQNDSFEVVFNTLSKERVDEAARHNLRRFAPLDLLFGKSDPVMKNYLLDQGLKEVEYEWFMLNGSSAKTVLGVDHYPWCVGIWRAGNIHEAVRRPSYILHDIIVEYWRRYPLPIMHMEVNGTPETALEICRQTYNSLSRLRLEGFPVVGMSWFGDELQIGWQNTLTGPTADEEYRVGLFYKGQLEPVGSLYAELAERGLPPTPRRQKRAV